jgi:hypothetical protein
MNVFLLVAMLAIAALLLIIVVFRYHRLSISIEIEQV